jgi:hypothetical protein
MRDTNDRGHRVCWAVLGSPRQFFTAQHKLLEGNELCRAVAFCPAGV